MYRIDLAALAHARGTFRRQAIDLGGAGTVTLPIGSRLNPPSWGRNGLDFQPVGLPRIVRTPTGSILSSLTAENSAASVLGWLRPVHWRQPRELLHARLVLELLADRVSCHIKATAQPSRQQPHRASRLCHRSLDLRPNRRSANGLLAWLG